MLLNQTLYRLEFPRVVQSEIFWSDCSTCGCDDESTVLPCFFPPVYTAAQNTLLNTGKPDVSQPLTEKLKKKLSVPNIHSDVNQTVFQLYSSSHLQQPSSVFHPVPSVHTGSTTSYSIGESYFS